MTLELGQEEGRLCDDSVNKEKDYEIPHTFFLLEFETRICHAEV